MLKGIFEKNSTPAKLVLTAIIVLMGFLLTAAVVALLHLTNEASLKTAQAALSIGTFIIPPLVLAYLMSKNPENFLSFRKIYNAKLLVLSIIVIILAIPVINFLAEWNAGLSLPKSLAGLEQWMRNAEETAKRATEQLLQTSSIGGLLTNVLVVAALPAIGEELIFRALLQKLFAQWTKNAHVAIWITAFVFSAVHLQFLGFVPRLLLGAYLGYLLFWSGSIWLPILVHFMNNALAVVCYFLYENGYIRFEIDGIGTGTTIWITIICIFLLTLILFWQHKFKKIALYLYENKTQA